MNLVATSVVSLSMQAFFLSFFLCLSFIGSWNSIPQPPMSEKVKAGKVLFDKRCIECHKPKIIDNYSREKWDRVLPRMGRKAKLNDEEFSQVQAFIYHQLGSKK